MGSIATFPNTLLARLQLPGETRQVRPSTAPTVAHTYAHGNPFLIAQHLFQRADGLTSAIIGEPAITTDEGGARLKKIDARGLLSLYDSWGIDCFRSLRGPWASVIVDPHRARIMIATDRMGHQPLYFRIDGASALVGSSLDSVRELAGTWNLDPQALYQYMYFHMIPAPSAVVSGCQKLGPAMVLEITPDTQRLRRYWNPAFTEDSSVAKPVAYEQLKRYLKMAVARCVEGQSNDTSTLGKVPQNHHAKKNIGVFLSGGLDSSTVAGMLSELQGGSCSAYAIGFDVEGYDEVPYARITASHFGIRLNEYYVTPADVEKALPKIAAACDEPFGNSSTLPAYFCAHMAHEDGVDLLLAGDGGDELFAGNTRYVHQTMFEHYLSSPQSLRSTVIEPLINALPPRVPLASKAQSFLHQANVGLPDRLYHYGFLQQNDPATVFTDNFLQRVDKTQPLRLLRNIYQQPQGASYLHKMLFLDWQITLSDNDLRKVTHACTLAGVSVRFPMLDEDLVTFSATIPSAWKLPCIDLPQHVLKGSRLRHFYKEALKQWLPDATIRKRKHGFGLPFGHWMRSHKPLQDLAYDSIATLKNRNIFNPRFLDNAIAMHRDDHASYFGELVWVLMSLELWLKAKQPDYRVEKL